MRGMSMTSTDSCFECQFTNYVNECLLTITHSDIKGLVFNLYEDDIGCFSMEIVGTLSFDDLNLQWTDDEIDNFGTREEPFVWQDENWEKAQERVVSSLRNMIYKADHKSILWTVGGIAVGFVDGNIEIVEKTTS